MKKTVKKKLVLAKETVRRLTTQDLRDAVGGSDVTCAGTCGCNSWEWLAKSTSYACPR
jgi:hypothetical protein